MRVMHWRTWRPGMRPRIPLAAGVLTGVVTVACLLAAACTSASTRGISVSGRLRVWAVTTSGTTGTACGRHHSGQGSLLGTVSSDGRHLGAGNFHLLGVTYGWLTATIANTPAGAAMQAMQGQFGAGRSGHRSLRGTFTLARFDASSDAVADSQQPTSPPTSCCATR